jgi:hypothetical protein
MVIAVLIIIVIMLVDRIIYANYSFEEAKKSEELFKDEASAKRLITSHTSQGLDASAISTIDYDKNRS